MINEYILTNHWNQRVNERSVNINNITYPSAIFEGVANPEELKADLDNKIKKIVRGRIVGYQTLQDPDASKYYATIIAVVQLRKDGKIYIPTIETVADGKTHVGNAYVGFSQNNTLLTLENIPQDKVDPHSLAQQMISHLGKKVTEDQVEVTKAANHMVLLDVDSAINQLAAGKEAPMGVPKAPEDLPYKVKKDYLKSTPGRPNFVTYNGVRGEIVSSEQGMGGKWNNVVINLPSGRKTFKTMYASGYFNK